MLARYASDDGEIPCCPRCGRDEVERHRFEWMGKVSRTFDCAACGLIWGFKGDFIDIEENRRKMGRPTIDP